MKKILPKPIMKTYRRVILVLLISFSASGFIKGQDCEIQIDHCPPENITVNCADSINAITGEAGTMVSWDTPDFSLFNCTDGGTGDNTFFVSFDLNANQLSEECWTLERVTRHGNGYLKLFNGPGTITYAITPYVYIEGSIPVSIDIEYADGDYDVELWLIDEYGNQLPEMAGSFNAMTEGTGTYTYTTNNIDPGIYRLKFTFNGDGSNANRADNITFNGIIMDTECTADIDFVVTGPAKGFYPIGDNLLSYVATYTPIDGEPVSDTCTFHVIVNGLYLDNPITKTDETCAGDDGSILLDVTSSNGNNTDFQYSLNDGIWTDFPSNTNTLFIDTLSAGDKTLNIRNTSLPGSCELVEPITFTIEEILSTPSAPSVSVTDPTCDADGSAVITNYNADLVYSFDPTGPTVDASGNISGYNFGQLYNVIATNIDNCLSDAASFTIEEQLEAPEAPTSNGDITECEESPVQTIDANDALTSSTGITWFDAASGGSVVTDPVLNATGSVTYYAEYSNGTCSSLSRTAVTLTINEAPEAPTSNGDITECEESPVQTIDANDALTSSTGVTWFDAASGGSVVTDPVLNATGSVTYYAEYSNGTCSSLSRTAVTLTIDEAPEAPTSNGDITECEESPVQTIDANDALTSSTGVTWFDAASGGSVVTDPVLNATGSVTYYAEYSNGTCSSLSRTAVTLTINEAPEAPTSNGDITECEESPVQTIDANDALTSSTGVTWFDAASGGSVVTDPVLNATGSVTYYAEYSNGTCSSLSRTAVTLTIDEAPEAPTSNGDITECEESPVQTIDANDALTSSTGITWFDAASGGSVVTDPVLNATGSVTYYAEYSNGTCSSLSRTAVTLTINEAPEAPTSNGDITECEESPVQTIDANDALTSSTGVTWFDAASGGSVVTDPVLNATGSVTYYAEYSNGTCSSLSRTAVTLTIDEAPEAPTSNGDITECEESPVQTIDANDALTSSTGITWFDAASGGSVVTDPVLNATGSVTYYAEYSNGTCSSLSRTAVTLTINEAPEAPTSNGDITECEESPVQTIDANDALTSSTGVTWFDAASGGSVVTDPVLNATGSVTYYAEYSNGTCSSLSRTAVTLTIDEAPEAPTSNGDITECEESPVQTIDANDALTSSTGITWFDAASGGSVVTDPVLNATGSVTYYAEYSNGTCSSLSRTAVTLTINEAPEAPTSNGDITECEESPVQTIDANDALTSSTGVTWFDAASGGSVVTDPVLNATGSVTYYAEYSNGTCSSLSRTAVTLTIDEAPEAPTSNGDITECEESPVQTIDANDALTSSTGITWFDAASGGSVVTDPVLNATGSVTYYAEYSNGTCSSLSRTAVTLTINEAPEAPTSNGDITECEESPVQTIDANDALTSSTGVTWFDAASGGSVVTDPVLNATGSVTYYAEYSNGTCSSLSRTAVTLTIDEAPEAPTSNGDITECEESPVQTIDANDALTSSTGITWFDAASGGSVVTDPVLNATGSVTYYAEYSNGTCSSLSRTAVTLTINEAPEAPTSNGDITECEESPVQTIDANDALTSSTGITWFDAASGGSVVTDPVLNATGSVTYYAEYSNGTCSSLSRTAVTLTIDEAPEAPTSNGDITECEESPVQTIDANDALTSSTGVTWFDAASGGSMVTDPVLNATGSVTYYAEYSNGTCSSLSRTAVTLTINEAPEAPTSNGDITECEESPVQTIDANDALTSSTGVTWFDAASGGSVVTDPVLNATGSVTYYAEYSNGTCSSLSRTAVTLTINEAPEAPTSNGDITECEESPVQTIDANDALTSSTGVTWFDAASGGSVVTDPVLNATGSVTYYAEYSNGTCSSLSRTAVTLTINEAPEAPTSNGDITECEESPVQTIDANDALTSSTGVTWFDAASGGSVVTDPVLNATGSVTYYAEYSNGTCSSLSRTAVTLTINEAPEAPTSNGDITECEESPVQTIDANDALTSSTGVTWFDAASGGSVVTDPVLNATGSVTYYAEYSNGTCSSLSRTAVTLTIDEAPDVTVTQLTSAECGFEDGVAKVSVTNGEGVYDYLWDNGNTDATVYNLSGGTHTVTVTFENGCSTTASINISEFDTSAPTVSCPADIDTTVAIGNCQIELDIPAPTVKDNCATGLIAINDFNDTKDASGIYLAGTTVVTWTATDNSGNSATCEQIVTVKSQPIANDDLVEIHEIASQLISPLLNDTDCDNNIDSSSFEITTEPQNGIISELNTQEGTFAYTPAEGFMGTDSIQYKICDGDNLCDEAWIIIDVSIDNNPPVAMNDTIVAGDCKATIFDVLLNDTDPDGDELTMPVIISDVNVGSLSANADGTFEYTPVSDYEGDVTFTYEVCDVQSSEANQLCAQATVIIKVSKDTDCDNVPDNIDIDADNDGILNTDDGISADNDNDGIPNYLDIDSDNDGIVDNIEGQPENNYRVPLWTDTDGDGWDDEYDPDNGGTYFQLTDTDSDGTPDFVDTDTDDDEIDDYIEGYDVEGTDGNPDGIADILPSGTDSDGDGLDDNYDLTDGLSIYNNPIGSNAPLPDYDGDNTRDWRDSEDGKPTGGDDSKAITDCQIFIPNGFSPDGDNINDYFEIRMDCDGGESTFGEQHPNSKMLIYNRWGSLLYEKEGYGQNNDTDSWWDGRSENNWTVGGNKVPSGTYVYVLVLDDGTVYKGTIFVNY